MNPKLKKLLFLLLPFYPVVPKPSEKANVGEGKRMKEIIDKTPQGIVGCSVEEEIGKTVIPSCFANGELLAKGRWADLVEK